MQDTPVISAYIPGCWYCFSGQSQDSAEGCESKYFWDLRLLRGKARVHISSACRYTAVECSHSIPGLRIPGFLAVDPFIRCWKRVKDRADPGDSSFNGEWCEDEFPFKLRTYMSLLVFPLIQVKKRRSSCTENSKLSGSWSSYCCACARRSAQCCAFFSALYLVGDMCDRNRTHFLPTREVSWYQY